MLAPMKSHAHPSITRALRKRLTSSRRRPPPRVRIPYPVFIAYHDVPAARQAITRLERQLQSQDADRELFPMLWRFDQLDQPRWRQMALRDASRAVAIVLAMGTAPSLNAGTDAWLTALTAQQHGAVISALALLGDDAWTISLQQTATARPARIDAISSPPAANVDPIELRRESAEAACAA